MSDLVILIENCWIDTPAVIPDAEPQLFLVVTNLNLNAAAFECLTALRIASVAIRYTSSRTTGLSDLGGPSTRT